MRKKTEMLVRWVSTLASGAVGGFMGYILAVNLEEEKEVIVRKSEVYSDFVRAFWNYSRDKSEKFTTEFFLTKGGIIIYGSSDVVKRLYEAESSNSNNDIGQTMCLMQEMRKDLYGFDDVNALHICEILSGNNCEERVESAGC